MKNRQRKPRRVEIDLSTHPGRHHKPVKLCEKLERLEDWQERSRWSTLVVKGATL